MSLSTSRPISHYSSHQQDPRPKHPHPKETQSRSQHTQRSISNTNDVDDQHGSQHASISAPRKASTALSSYTGSDTVETTYPNVMLEHQHPTYDYTILGISAQFAGKYEYQVPAQAIANPGTMRCPYHDPIFECYCPNQGLVVCELDTLSLYLNAGPSEQYALFRRPDTGMFSTEKECFCHLSGRDPIQV